MTTSPDVLAAIAANQRRYIALKREGQNHAPRALPPPSPRPAPPPASEDLLHREAIPGGWYWSSVVKRGQALRIETPEGEAAVALVAWSLQDASERLNYADTVKIQWTAALGKGRVLFSDMGRVMLSIIEDSCGAHDLIAGGSTPASVRRSDPAQSREGTMQDGPGGSTRSFPARNTRDNLRLAAGKHGLSPRDVPPCISFFAPVRTDADGRLVWVPGRRSLGDYVDLRAEMDLIVALSNCPHPLDPSGAEPPAVVATRFVAPPVGADDLCRTATAEAARGFDNTHAHLASLEQRP